MPFDLARASDCLAAPNSPAPKGSHWYYHLNRETQQKCWYVRSSEKQSQHATAPSTDAAACLQQAPGRSVQPRLVTLMDPRAVSNCLLRQYRIPLPIRYRTDRRPRLLPEKIRSCLLHEKAPRSTLVFSRRHRMRWYGPIRRQWPLQSTQARLMRWQLTLP